MPVVIKNKAICTENNCIFSFQQFDEKEKQETFHVPQLRVTVKQLDRTIKQLRVHLKQLNVHLKQLGFHVKQLRRKV